MNAPLRTAAFADVRPPAQRDVPAGQRAVPIDRSHAHQLVRSLGRPLCSGNRLELLEGVDAASTWLRTIDSAGDHVNLCGALVPAGGGADVADRLVARARLGVRINLCCDGPDGLDFDAQALERLAAAGVGLCRPARAPATPWLAAWLRRGHARRLPMALLVIDGRRAFVGAGGTDTSGRPTLLLSIEGPAVRRIQQVFLTQWRRRSLEPVQPGRYFPPLMTVGMQRIALFDGDDPAPSKLALTGALALARERVVLSTSGPSCGHRLQAALVEAASRGVAVTVLHSARDEARLAWQSLANAGIALHEQAGRGDDPAGVCTIDGAWVGFATGGNETGIVVLDRDLAMQAQRRLHATLPACANAGANPDGAFPGPPWRRWLARVRGRVEPG